MTKIAFIFSGQGAQYIGMGKEICENYLSSELIFKEANEALNFDLKEMIFNGNEDTLRITENTQPAILTTSIACMQPLLEEGIEPAVVAGLSLGEYSAHVAAGTFKFKDAVKLVRKRGKYMQEAVPLGVGTMAAIIGLERKDVLDCCKQASDSGYVDAANYNCPGQIVIAGHIKAVEKAVEIAKEMGAKRSMILPVSAPFHCSLLINAGKNLEKEVSDIQIDEFKILVISNVTADYIESKEKVKGLLVRQVTSPIFWEDSINRMINDGIDTFIEIGPGKVLSGFVRKINKDVKVLNVEDMESLEKTMSLIKN
ncbi:MAG: ACP S-malonyltransferase [Ignavibacteriales bacterium]